MIDFKSARAAFEEYLKEYDRDDDKIRLKIVHTYCVVDCVENIARRMGFPGKTGSWVCSSACSTISAGLNR